MKSEIARIVKKQYPEYSITDIKWLPTNEDFLNDIRQRVTTFLKNPALKNEIRTKYKIIPGNPDATIDLISKELRSRMLYQIEPPGIEIVNHNWKKILHGFYKADCDDLAMITSVIFKTLYPIADIRLNFVALGARKKLHHAYIHMTIPGFPKKYLIDLTRKYNQKKTVNNIISAII